MPKWEARYFCGGDQKPFYIEEFTADNQAEAVRLAWARVVENVPVGVQQGRMHTVYRPGMATHVTVLEKTEGAGFRS